MEARACGRNRVKRQTGAPTDLSIPSDLPVSRKRRRARAEPEPGRDRKTSRNIGTLGGLSQGPRARPTSNPHRPEGEEEAPPDRNPSEGTQRSTNTGPDVSGARGPPGTRFPRKERGAVMVQSPSPARPRPSRRQAGVSGAPGLSLSLPARLWVLENRDDASQESPPPKLWPNAHSADKRRICTGAGVRLLST